MLEKVQRKFLRYLAYREHIIIENHNYTGIIQLSKLNSLKHRREVADIIFLHKLLINKIDSPELLSCVNIKIQRLSARHRALFEPVLYTTNIGYNSPLNRFMRLSNIITSAPLDLDFFSLSTDNLKSKLSVLSTLH
uniref:Uncharacterized protein n=1 Tax=Cacopsylla melanoneura TaxID=428564 RepID=A0A8D8PSA8_9HEMI